MNVFFERFSMKKIVKHIVVLTAKFRVCLMSKFIGEEYEQNAAK